MKKISVLFLLVISCLCFAENFSAKAAKPKKVAVYVEGNIGTNEKSIVNSSFISRMSSNSDYVVFERNDAFIKALTKEWDYQLSGDVPDDEIRSVGKRFGVDYVIVVNVVVDDDDTCVMTAKIIDLETGRILKTVSDVREECTGSKSLSSFAKNVAYRLIDKKSK